MCEIINKNNKRDGKHGFIYLCKTQNKTIDLYQYSKSKVLCGKKKKMDILSQLRKFKSGDNNKKSDKSYEDFLTKTSTSTPPSSPKNRDCLVSSRQRKSLLSILHILDPEQQGITKKHSEAIAKYLMSASLADTEDKREKRLFELEYGADALAEIENEEVRANLDVDDEDDDDDSDSDDDSVGSLKKFVVEDDEEDEYGEEEEDVNDGEGDDNDEEEYDNNEEEGDDDEVKDGNGERGNGVVTTVVEFPILDDITEEEEEEMVLPTTKRAKTTTGSQ